MMIYSDAACPQCGCHAWSRGRAVDECARCSMPAIPRHEGLPLMESGDLQRLLAASEAIFKAVVIAGAVVLVWMTAQVIWWLA